MLFRQLLLRFLCHAIPTYKRILLGCFLLLLSGNVFATTAPVLRSAVGSGSTITLTYDIIDSGFANIVPAAGVFSFSRNGGVGGQLSVVSTAINTTANTVTLGLNGLINLSDTNMRVSYTPNGTNDIQNVAGDKVASFSNVFVSNTMPTFNVNSNALLFGTPTLKSGTGLSVGSKILFSNVITLDGQVIDAVVTVKALTSGTTITGMDTVPGGSPPGTITGFTDNWFTLNTTVGSAGGDADLTFEFIKGGTYGTDLYTSSTGVDVMLQNVAINSYDLDGAASGATQFQYQEFGGFATYTVSAATALTQTQVGALTHFQTTTGGNVSNGPGTAQGDTIRVMALYEAIHSFEIKTGAVATGGISYFYIDFSVGPAWANPATPTYKIPTVNRRVTNDTTPDLTGTFVGTVANSTDTAWQFSILVNSVTYTANTRSVSGNIVTLTNAATGLTAMFNSTTGLGTWSLTIPAANALPLNTYDVKATVNYGSSLANATAAGAKFTTDDTTNELVINSTPADTTAPSLTKIERLNPLGEVITPAALALQNYVDFKVTFSEAVTNVDVTDFQITGTGTLGTTTLSSVVVQSDTNVYTVRVSNIPSSYLGILDLNLLETNNLVDLAGNLLSKTPTPDAEGIVPTAGIDETYNVSTINYDYGDAPSGITVDTVARSYGSASHIRPTTPTIYLGTTLPDVDTTANQTTWQGQSTANGDDTTPSSPSDEGIAQLLSGAPANFPTLSAGDANYSLTLVCSGNGATVTGWIDFNKNGSFDVGEKKSGTCTANTVTLSWTTLTGLKTGSTFARFRIASVAGDVNLATGAAADGEVEDYPITIRPGIKIIKTLAPTADTGKFDLTITGGNPASPVGSSNPASNVGNTGTTGFIAVDAAGTITVQEIAHTGTTLSNYATTLSCKLGDGTTTVTLTASDLTNSTTRSGTFTAPAANSTGTAAQVVCTFTNTRVATVTLRKTWSGGILNDAVNITGTGLTTLASIANTANETDTGVTDTVNTGSVITLAENFTTGLSSNYAAALSCTGTSGLSGNILTVGNTDTAIVCTFTNTNPPGVPLVINKTTSGDVGSFDFTIVNGATTLPVVTVTTSAGNNPKSSTAQILTNLASTTITENTIPGWTTVSATCTDGTSTWTGIGQTVTIPTLATGKSYTCNFNNSKSGFSVSGAVFKDTGTGGGTANNGSQNGSEAGLAGVVVKLTDCKVAPYTSTVYSSATTDSAGHYALSTTGVPAGDVCIEETNPSGYISTGGTATAGGTYDLSTDKIRFTFATSTHYTGMNFGDIPPNQFITDGIKTGLPGSTLIYTHTFTAASAGTVTFSTSAKSVSPTMSGWSEVLYQDSNCNSTLDSGEPLLTSLTITEGQNVCLIQKEFIPANAPMGASNTATVQASFKYANTSTVADSLSTRRDITSVSDTALFLQKEVRNVTTGTGNDWATSNSAKSGQTLEYRITYTNNGSSAINNLIINDFTPAFTKFLSADCDPSATAIPASLDTCILSSKPSVGGTGALKWTFSPAGVKLNAGGIGSVKFRVSVD